VVLHEANVLPGRAIKWFSGRAAVVAGSFDESRHYLQKIDLVNTGMPLRLELEQAADLARNSEPDFDPFTILVMGGSRGSTRLNEIVSHALVRLKKQRHNFKVIHLTGREDEEKMMAYYAEHEISAEVKAFSTNMSPYYLAANLAICRAGAATCAELSAFGLPALLIPYPHAVHDHQTANAEAMERAKSGDLVAEANLDGQWLSEYLDGCMNTPERLNKMSAASRRRIKSRPAEALANVVEQAARHEVASEPSI
jgi:UDP-N-acetylglucosamine--N-acetylmuramyl-(pentapeptide) pyrophosphoryl-undecaprenol N-acetylglucosamine transferase